MRGALSGLLLALMALMACQPSPGPDPAALEWSVAFEAKDVGWLLSAFGPTASDVVAVGGSPASGRIMRFDGSAWAPRDPPAGTPLINWAFGFSSSDLYFVGGRGTILRYDGVSYTRSATLTDQNLWGIWGSSPSALWAVEPGTERGVRLAFCAEPPERLVLGAQRLGKAMKVLLGSTTKDRREPAAMEVV